jgi:hypothetical protein
MLIKLGHKYQARYDQMIDNSISMNSRGLTAHEAARLIETAKIKKYVCDICVRCGHKIIR